MLKVTHYKNNRVQNTLLTILVALSPNTPKTNRKPLAHYRENERRNRFNNIITK